MLQKALSQHDDFDKLWMMAGQIEEQVGNVDTAREFYSKGVIKTSSQ